jgi:hypothetical protein
LGADLSGREKRVFFGKVKENQQKILAEKRIRHRNFGTYSKHKCGYDTFHLNGLMIQTKNQSSAGSECLITFKTDKNRYAAKEKSIRLRKKQKAFEQIGSKRELESTPIGRVKNK